MEYLYRPRAVNARATQSPSEIVSFASPFAIARRRLSDPPSFSWTSSWTPRVSPALLCSQGSRPTARGKKRGGRSEDPLARLTRKLDRWIDKNPVLSGALSVAVVGALMFLFWLSFGGALTRGYDAYLKRHADPYVKRVVRFCAPHFVALRDLLGEKRGALETARRMFTPRDVVVKEL